MYVISSTCGKMVVAKTARNAASYIYSIMKEWNDSPSATEETLLTDITSAEERGMHKRSYICHGDMAICKISCILDVPEV